MPTKTVFVSSDTTDLENATKSTGEAILANVTTTVHLKTDKGATMKDGHEEVFKSASRAAAETHPFNTQVVLQSRSDFEQFYQKGGDAKSTVVHPTQKMTDFFPIVDETARHHVPLQPGESKSGE